MYHGYLSYDMSVCFSDCIKRGVDPTGVIPRRISRVRKAGIRDTAVRPT